MSQQPWPVVYGEYNTYFKARKMWKLTYAYFEVYINHTLFVENDRYITTR